MRAFSPAPTLRGRVNDLVPGIAATFPFALALESQELLTRYAFLKASKSIYDISGTLRMRMLLIIGVDIDILQYTCGK